MAVTRLRKTCALWAAGVLLLLLGAGVLDAVEAPESVHRRAFFQLDAKRLAQAMWLEGAMSHGVPSRFACSSLEGAGCLYSPAVRRHFTEDLSTALLGGDSGAADSFGATKMKLVLLKPGNGQGMKELLKKMETAKGLSGSSDAAAARDQQQAAQQLLEDSGGEVVFEGDPASLSDMDTVVQAMLAAMGVSETGRVADSLRRQLAKMLTEAEFAQSRTKKGGAAAAADGGTADAGPDAGSSSKDGDGSSASSEPQADGSAQQHKQDKDADAVSQEDLAVSIRNLLNSIRAVQKQAGGAVADQHDEQPSEEEPPAQEQMAAQEQPVDQNSEPRPVLEAEPEPEPQPETARPAQEAPQPLHAGQARRRASSRGGGQRHGAAKQRPPQAGHQTADATGAGAGAAPENVYVDDETGEQFVLPDEVPPEGEERVYVDDRTGHTYVVADDSEAGAGSGGRGGRLSRRLSDDMAWLDGLTDVQYDEYMDNYYEGLDREDAAREQRDRAAKAER